MVDDGYRWKYLYTINPTQIVKFTTDKFIPVLELGDTTTESIKMLQLMEKLIQSL